MVRAQAGLVISFERSELFAHVESQLQQAIESASHFVDHENGLADSDNHSSPARIFLAGRQALFWGQFDSAFHLFLNAWELAKQEACREYRWKSCLAAARACRASQNPALARQYEQLGLSAFHESLSDHLQFPPPADILLVRIEQRHAGAMSSNVWNGWSIQQLKRLLDRCSNDDSRGRIEQLLAEKESGLHRLKWQSASLSSFLRAGNYSGILTIVEQMVEQMLSEREWDISCRLLQQAEQLAQMIGLERCRDQYRNWGTRLNRSLRVLKSIARIEAN